MQAVPRAKSPDGDDAGGAAGRTSCVRLLISAYAYSSSLIPRHQ